MSKKYKNYHSKRKKATNTKAFDFHTEAIDTLVTADESTVEKIDSKEINSYKKDKISRLPIWFKALFVKFWFNGAVCFFFFWGLSLYIEALFDKLLVLAIAMGIIVDLLVNNILRFFDDSGNFTKWAMFPQKKFWTIFANILYSAVIVVCVFFTYAGINYAVSGGIEVTPLGVEPLLYGLFYLLFDLLFVGLKHLIIKIVSDANKKAIEENKKG